MKKNTRIERKGRIWEGKTKREKEKESKTSPRGQQSRTLSYNNTDCLKMSENVKKYYRMSKNNKKC